MTASLSLGTISNEAAHLAAQRLQALRCSGAQNLHGRASADSVASSLPPDQCASKNTSLLAFTSRLETAAEEHCRPNLGLEMAAAGLMQGEGILTDLFLYAPTVGHALNDVVRYFPVIQTRTAIQLEHRDGLARFSYGIKAPCLVPSLQDAAYTLGKVYLSLLRGVGDRLSLARVTLVSSAPSSTLAYQTFFKAPVTFDASVSALWFPAAFLETGLPGANMERYRLVRERFDARMPAKEDPAVLEDALRAWLLQSARRWDAKLEHVAGDFGITPRTLQRRLKDQGICFLDMRARVRMETAQRMLATSRRSVTSIAEQLGFSEISAFTRAFRSHTQQSPRAFRQATFATC
jgi:AraC-like DNA-binding protein